jgi:hypothetical protein
MKVGGGPALVTGPTDLHVSVYFTKLEGKIQIKELAGKPSEIQPSPIRIL